MTNDSASPEGISDVERDHRAETTRQRLCHDGEGPQKPIVGQANSQDCRGKSPTQGMIGAPAGTQDEMGTTNEAISKLKANPKGRNAQQSTWQMAGDQGKEA